MFFFYREKNDTTIKLRKSSSRNIFKYKKPDRLVKDKMEKEGLITDFLCRFDPRIEQKEEENVTGYNRKRSFKSQDLGK